MLLLVSALTIALQLSPPLPAAGTVTRVVDGDTVVVERVGYVRLIGVDAPESKHPRKAVQRFGRESAAFLTRLVEGRTVTIEYDQRTRDRWGRVLAYLRLRDGRSVNAEIIRQGYGFALTTYPFQRLEEHRRLERDAREEKRGLWGDAFAADGSSGAR